MSVHVYKERFWRRHVERFAASKLSQMEYCKRHRIKSPTLRYWRLHFGATKHAPKPRKSAFVPVDVVPAPERPRQTAVRIILPDGTTVEAGGDVEAAVKIASLLRGRGA